LGPLLLLSVFAELWQDEARTRLFWMTSEGLEIKK
jgi:hypothetical protein